MRCVVIHERNDTGWGADAPDLPGCIATGATLEQTRRQAGGTPAVREPLAGRRDAGGP